MPVPVCICLRLAEYSKLNTVPVMQALVDASNAYRNPAKTHLSGRFISQASHTCNLGGGGGACFIACHPACMHASVSTVKPSAAALASRVYGLHVPPPLNESPTHRK